ncbi:MAG: aspartate kinase, partial [Saprospiraceae bacterium]|nr:aspartate kinase [Saprospiraceae bacterium]
MSLKVYKFGGASVKDASHIYNVSNILTKDKGDQIFVIVSAIGKTTNALEIVFQKYIEEGKEGFLNGMVEILDAHLDEADKLKLDSAKLQSKLEVIINDCLVNLERAIKINKSAVYDQIVSMGELFSTNLLSAYLQSKDLRVAWVDLRKIIATDDNFQEGCVDIQQVEKNVNDHIKPLFENVDFVIGQGFIGSAPNGLTTTLGREGSDYSAALMAYGLGVDTLTIWKDVPGVLTADPRRFENVEKLDRMSYKEAIEMTYYGAQV